MAERGGFISVADRAALDRFPNVDDIAIRSFDLSARDLELIHRRRTDADQLDLGYLDEITAFLDQHLDHPP